MFTVDLLEYQDGLHVLEIIGLTHVTEILRDTLEFFGLGWYILNSCDKVKEGNEYHYANIYHTSGTGLTFNLHIHSLPFCFSL